MFQETVKVQIVIVVSSQATKTMGVQRGTIPFDAGFPIGARSPCWQGNPKGTASPWREESKETGGFVAH